MKQESKRNAYQNRNWWKKTADAGIAEKLTIRTANDRYCLFCTVNYCVAGSTDRAGSTDP